MVKPERTILAIAGGVLAIVAVSIVAILILGSPDVDEYPPDTPQGTVQRYLNAIRDQDYDTAESLVSERVLRDFGRDGFLRMSFCPARDGRRIRVVRTDITGDRATVVLSIQQVSGSGLSFDRYSYEHATALVLEDGDWKIDESYFCV